MHGLIGYAGEDPTEKPFRRRTALDMGYTQEFIDRAKLARERAARAKLNELGLMKFRNFGMPEWAREIVREVCERRGIYVDDLAGFNRRYKVVRARNEAMYLVKAAKKSLSSPQLASWFNRNHVSVLYGISSHAHAEGLPPLTDYDAVKWRKGRREAMAEKARSAKSPEFA